MGSARARSPSRASSLSQASRICPVIEAVAVRRPAAAGAAGQRGGRTARAARRRRRVVRGPRVPGRGGPPRPGGAGLGPGRPPAIGPLGRLRAQRTGRHRTRAPDPVPGRRDRGGCRAGRADGRGRVGGGLWKKPNGAWFSPLKDWNRYLRTGVDARKWFSRWRACGWPAGAETSRSRPSRRNRCWPPREPPTRRGSGLARTCGRWR